MLELGEDRLQHCVDELQALSLFASRCSRNLFKEVPSIRIAERAAFGAWPGIANKLRDNVRVLHARKELCKVSELSVLAHLFEMSLREFNWVVPILLSGAIQ